MSHQRNPTSSASLLTLLMLTLLPLLLIACGTVIKDPEEHQAIQDYLSACATSPEKVLLLGPSNWGEARELFEREYRKYQSLAPPDPFREFHQAGLSLLGQSVQFAITPHPSEPFNSSGLARDPSFQAALIDYFVATTDLREDVRDMLVEYECLPIRDSSGDRDELEAVQEYATACADLIALASEEVWPTFPEAVYGLPGMTMRAELAEFAEFAQGPARNIQSLPPPPVLRKSHDVFVGHWSALLEAAQISDESERLESIAAFLRSPEADIHRLARSRAFVTLPHDVATLLQLNQCNL